MEIIERFGDVNPIEFGGSVLFKDKDGEYFIETTQGLETMAMIYPNKTDKQLEKSIHVHHLGFDCINDSWVNKEDIESFTGYKYNLNELNDKAQYLIDAAQYYGLHEFSDPTIYTYKELEKKWKL